MIHEFVTLRFKPEIGAEEQHDTMRVLGLLVEHHEGFVSREVFADSDGNWIDHIEWESLPLAQASAEALGKEPKAAALFARFAPDSVQLRHYRRVDH